MSIPDEYRRHHHGRHWLPEDHRIHQAWLQRRIAHIDALPDNDKDHPLSPALQEFRDAIEANPRLYMYFVGMWDEVPHVAAYRHDPTGSRQIRSYEHMWKVLQHTLTAEAGPEWTNTAAVNGMVGVPLCAIFDYAMATPSGHAAFLDPEVNSLLKKLLNAWGKSLQTTASAKVLHDGKDGWFGPVAQREVMAVANAPYETKYRFEDMFVCDPKKPHYGYTSWDDFFTRKVHDAARPVADPNDDAVVANACESRTFAVARNAALRARFWIKGQPYSVRDMLAHDPLADQFNKATVYQAFLSALSYHRWHAPVSGTVRRAFVQDGTYFSEPLFEGEGEGTEKIDKKGISVAQGYLTALATRAIVFIEADNPAIGLMAFVAVGMDEVSTCELTVREGQHVRKGEQTGMFHFGGSSHVLLFRSGVDIQGFPEPGRDVNVPVRGKLAVVGGGSGSGSADQSGVSTGTSGGGNAK